MPAVVRHFAHYRASGAGWMLGRFVCPATALAVFSEHAEPLLPRDAGAIPWRLAVTGSGDVAADLAQMTAFNARHRVCFDECGAIADCYEVKASTPEEIRQLAAATPRELQVYIEVPFGDALEPCVESIAAVGRRAKMRTGGVTAAAFPSARDVVRFLRACLTHGVPAKATAGLHHPLGGQYRLTYEPDAPTGRMFGFLTVLLAAAHLGNGGADAEAVRLLEETDPRAFEMNDLHVAWSGPNGPVVFSRDALLQMRERALVSIGSCSFTEPVEESRALGFV
jgi:hypothetical protein